MVWTPWINPDSSPAFKVIADGVIDKVYPSRSGMIPGTIASEMNFEAFVVFFKLMPDRRVHSEVSNLTA